MFIRKKIFILVFGVFGALVLFNYQNCSQVDLNTGFQNELPSETEDTGLATVIDDVNLHTKLLFFEDKLQFHFETDQFSIDGICSEHQNRATLRWSLYNNDKLLLDNGFSVCMDSTFIVTTSSELKFDCHETLFLEAQLGLGEKAIVQLQKECEPIVSIPDSDFENCEFHHFSNQCQKVCFSLETGTILNSTLVSEENCQYYE